MTGLGLGVVFLELVSLVMLDPRQRVRIKWSEVLCGYLDSELSMSFPGSLTALWLCCVSR